MDLGALDKYGRTPARRVATYGKRRCEAARYLLELTKEWDIFTASALGDTERVTQLLAADPSLLHAQSGATGWRGETPLNLAAQYGQLAVVERLTRAGAEVNRRAASGVFPLHLAARNGHNEVAALLLERGARMNVLDDHHQGTPRDWAEFQGHPHMVEFLRHRAQSAASD